jgi:hypothetical protein
VSRAPILSDRALNRATLARQHLLERVAMAPHDLVAALVGMQAQTTQSWYLTFWSRLTDVDPVAIGTLVESRRLVRMTAMRGTIHLVTADDGPRLRAFTQPAIARLLRNTFGRGLRDVDLVELERIVREVVGDNAIALDDIADALARRWPSADRFALAQAGRGLVPLVHAPPRGVWGRSGPVRLALLDGWVGEPVPARVDPASIVRRYLAAYGPASVADAQSWSGLTGLATVFDGLRPELATFSDDRGRELFDLPDALRPDAEVAAPVRFLADYDNVLLAHADRSRFAGEAERAALTYVSGPIPGMILVDGRVAGTWFAKRERDVATATVTLVAELDHEAKVAVEAEADAVLGFLHATAGARRIVLARS